MPEEPPVTMIHEHGSLETPADKRRYVRRLLGMHFWALIGTAIRIAIAAGAIVLCIENAQEDSSWSPNLVVAGVIAFFCLLGASDSHAAMIDRWRDYFRPLPLIDGSEMVLIRNPFTSHDRFQVTMIGVGWTAFWAAVTAYNWPSTKVTVLGGFFVLQGFLILKGIWIERSNKWEPLVMDGEGFEDRSGSDGRIGWHEVAAVRWDSGDIEIKLAKPREIKRRRFRDWWSLRSRIETVEVQTHGISLDKHRIFRLLQAHWRFSRARAGSSAPSSTAPLGHSLTHAVR